MNIPMQKTSYKSESRPLSLGIDIGGTFSDLVIYDSSTRVLYPHKELTTYDDPARGVLEGIDKLLSKHDISASRIGRVVHATTLFTNALLERRGAKTGLLTTKGFRDVLEIGRERRYELYDLNIRRPDPLVPRDLRREVKERITAEGRIHTPLDLAELHSEVLFLVNTGVTSIAICFLHSYKNPQHEMAAAAAIRSSFPGIDITCSHEVAPVVREYERVSTTVANAYIKPLAADYLDVLTAGLQSRGVKAGMLMMVSNGGLSSIEDVKIRPIKLLESGPAAGVISAAASGAQEGKPSLLAFDMGGTTAKLCVVNNGEPAVAHMFEAARQKRFMKGSGIPILTPSIELIEIGAGGGSIAKKGAMGLLKVGPESAGSTPGPASYGLGGTDPTVTDANFTLGYLDQENFAGGTMRIDCAGAKAAISELAKQCNLDVTRAAWGIFDLVNETMASAASVHVAESGRDPRQFVLVATGGGGPLHAYFIARKLGVKQIVCPAGSGVASAIGLLRAPAVSEGVRSILKPFTAIDWTELESSFQKIEEEAHQLLSSSVPDDLSRAKVRRFCECRFAGQSLEMLVALPPGPYTADSKPLFEQSFVRRYQEKFGRSPLRPDIELVTIRVTVTVEMEAIGSPEMLRSFSKAGESRKGTREVYFPECGGFFETPVFDRFLLKPEQTIEGPAIIQEPMSTIVMGPGAKAEMHSSGNVVVTLN